MQTTNCYLTFLDTGAYSKNCDSRILQKRFLRNKISGNEFNIPDRRYLTEDSRNVLPHVFIDNEAFGLSTHIMRPYWGNNLSVGKRVQKYGQSRAKRFIERAFGILTNKWRILHRLLNGSVDCTQNVVKACVIMNNFVKERDGFRFSCEGLKNVFS